MKQIKKSPTLIFASIRLRMIASKGKHEIDKYEITIMYQRKPRAESKREANLLREETDRFFLAWNSGGKHMK